ncbi:MAG: type VI secretion system tube protein Hcp [Pyrinomonadaceae bacterium]
MANDLFLKITSTKGEIPGESKKEGKTGQTELDSFSIGASQPGSWGSHGGGSTGKVSFSDISFTTYISKGSPKIFDAMKNHDALTEVIFSARKGVGDKQEDFYVVTLKDAVFTNYSIGANEHGAPQVGGSVNYKKIKIQYKEQLDNNTLGPWVEVEFDQAAGL